MADERALPRGWLPEGRGRWRWLLWPLGLALIAAIGYFLASEGLARSRAHVELNIYAFSTMQEVLTGAIFPAYERDWETRTGQEIELRGVFGPSGTLAEQILLGASADIALLSNRQHIAWLKLARLIDADVEEAMTTVTPMVIVVREGNPLGIAEFSDLGAEGVRVLHPDPISAGAGSWGLVAEYGAAVSRTGNPQVAREEVKAIWANVGWTAPSARAALTLFELGAGDALVTYEQDARLAAARGVPMEIVLPTRTVLAEHFICSVSDNLRPNESAAAEGFMEFLLSPSGHEELRRFQLRPAAAPDEGFPPVIEATTVDELGGWPRLYRELIEGFWLSEIAPELEPGGILPVFDAED